MSDTRRPSSERRPSSQGGPARRPTTASSRLAGRSQTRGGRPAPQPEAGSDESRRVTTGRSQELIDLFEKTGGKDRAKPIILMLTGVLLVVGGGLLAYSLATQSARKKAAEEAKATADSAVDTVTKLRMLQPEDFDGILAAIEREMPKTKKFREQRAKLDGIKTAVLVEKDQAEAKRRNLTLLEEAEKDVNDPSKLENVRQRLRDLQIARQGMDKEFGDRVAKLETDVTLNRLKFAAKDARDAAASASSSEKKLAAYNECVLRFRDYFKDKITIPKTDPVVMLYEELLRESDAIAEALFTPAYESSVDVIDLLNPREFKKYWKPSQKGLNHRFEGRQLIVEGVQAREKVQGVLAVDGWSMPWWDLVLTLEFEVVKTGFDLMMRYRPDGVPPYQISFRAGEGEVVEVGKSQRITIKVIGSKIITVDADGKESSDDVKTIVSRNGGFSFAIDPDAKIIITACELRVLMPKGGVKAAE